MPSFIGEERVLEKTSSRLPGWSRETENQDLGPGLSDSRAGIRNSPSVQLYIKNMHLHRPGAMFLSPGDCFWREKWSRRKFPRRAG